MARKKSNDSIPQDEMYLAQALATAKDRGLKWARLTRFRARNGFSCPKESGELESVCATGALELAGLPEFKDGRCPVGMEGVTLGNDNLSDTWDSASWDNGASLGHAFKVAMDAWSNDPSVAQLLAVCADILDTRGKRKQRK